MPLSSCTINSWSEQAEALTDLFAAGSCCFTPPRFADIGQLRFEVSQRVLVDCRPPPDHRLRSQDSPAKTSAECALRLCTARLRVSVRLRDIHAGVSSAHVREVVSGWHPATGAVRFPFVTNQGRAWHDVEHAVDDGRI